MKRKDAWRRLSGSVLFLALWILSASPALAATIYVGGDSDPYLDIQQAIDAAQNGDEIIVRDGVYSPPDYKGIDFKGKAITLRSEKGRANCIIDGGKSKRGFYFHSGESALSKIDGFTIRNCKSSGCGIYCRQEGGGIYCFDRSSPTIVNCTLNGN